MGFKKTILLAALCLGASSIQAEDIDYVMKITLSDGTVDKYVVDDRPRVILGDKFVRVVAEDISAEYEVQSVVSYTFEDILTGIEDVKDDGDEAGITFKYLDGETVSVIGLNEDDKIAVYSLSGSKIVADIERSEDAADISLRNLDAGTYIITINNSKSIKVFRR